MKKEEKMPADKLVLSATSTCFLCPKDGTNYCLRQLQDSKSTLVFLFTLPSSLVSMTKPNLSVDAPRQSKNMTETAYISADSELELLNIPEAAEFLRVAPVSVYRLVEKRAIRFYRVCSRLLFKKKDLIEFVTRGETDEITPTSYDRSKDTG